MVEMILCLCAAAAAVVLAILLLLGLRRPKPEGISRARACLVFGLPLLAVVLLFAVTLDRAPPHTVALAPHGWQQASPVTVKFVATDSGWGVHSTTYRIDGGPWVTGKSASLSSDGSHVVAFYSIDWMGRREAAHTVTVKIDSAPPVTSDDAKAWERGNVVIALIAKDTVSGVASTGYRLNNGPWLAGDAVHVSSDGQHLIRYYSVDRAGNKEAMRACSFTIDNGLPVTVAPDAVTVGQGYSTALAFRVVDATPKATVFIRVTGPHTATYGPITEPTNRLVTYRFLCRLPYGTYTYAVEAKDEAGNTAVQVGSNTLRKPAPVLTVAASVDNPFPTMNQWVTATCTVSDQYGNPVSGANVTFVWNYMTVIDTDTSLPTDSSGNASDSRSISHATSGYTVAIDVTATLGSQRATGTTSFTPQ